MLTIIDFLIIGTVLIAALIAHAWRGGKKYGTSTKEEFVGICASAIENKSQKETRKERVLELLREHGELGNAELREHLGVAGRTVVKYTSELERENKVEQMGNTGRGVVYRLK